MRRRVVFPPVCDSQKTHNVKSTRICSVIYPPFEQPSELSFSHNEGLSRGEILQEVTPLVVLAASPRTFGLLEPALYAARRGLRHHFFFQEIPPGPVFSFLRALQAERVGRQAG